jgi:hypothetical protein
LKALVGRRADTNRIVIGRNGGIERLIRMLEAHPYNAELCHIAFGALSNIAINSNTRLYLNLSCARAPAISCLRRLTTVLSRHLQMPTRTG